jgi:S-adenosylmethionine-diacylglycerol 3-amino-3-carboxypropyl transferase
MTGMLSVKAKINQRFFKAVHRRNLIYNTCWEDPALDRVALNLQPADRVLVITSAGCNALDYLLAGAGSVNAVDVNPIQNSLLELKVAAIRALEQPDFFDLFGNGRSANSHQLYREKLRSQLSPFARHYWDRHINFFLGKHWRSSFYYRGSAGFLARVALANAHILHQLRGPIQELLDAPDVAEQRRIYFTQIRERIWTPWLRWFLNRSFTLSLVGVPWPQRNQIQTQYPGGVPQFVRDAVEAVVTQLPFRDNYFWRVYFQGHYTPTCCPEYLKPANFEKLREAIDRLTIHTATVTDYLRGTEAGISKFVLLDHMDWMDLYDPQGLADEWTAILEKARLGARVIYRSAGLRVNFLDAVPVQHRGGETPLGPLLRHHPEWSAELHARDRVHMYGSFHIADLPET